MNVEGEPFADRIQHETDGAMKAEIDWSAIERFVGFGPPEASFVFVGMEEGLDKKADLHGDLIARSCYRPYMDLIEAQGELESSRKYVGEFAKCQRTWRPMCDLMLRFENKIPTRALRNQYQGTRLGRIPGQTLLTELLPYPRQRADDSWPYKHFGRFDSFEDYRDRLLGPRIELLKSEISRHPRRLIVCYGSRYWTQFKKVVSVKTWRAEKFLQLGTDGHSGAGVVLTQHFSLSQFNTDDDLARFYGYAFAVAK